MQEKRNIRLFILLVALMTTTGFAWWAITGEVKSPVDKTMFRIASDKTDRVELLSAHDTVTLRVENGKWRVNEAYYADLNMMQVLFATIDRIEPKRNVGINQRDSISRLLQTEGTTVRFFENNNLQLEFQAGGNARKTEAWYQLTRDMNPYVVVIPGYRAYGSGIFELDASGWRDKRVFNFPWRNFKSLTVSVFSEPAESFTISGRQNIFGVEGMAASDTTKINDYIDAVSLLVGDAFISKESSVAYVGPGSNNPAFRIEVMDIASRTYSLDVYAPVKNDPNILAKWGDEFILINREKIIPLARKKDYFKKKPTP
jgi:hypothetical protein